VSAHPKIVEFANPVDIPAALRAAADRIEAGEHPDLRFVVAVFVEKNNGFTTFGWGKMSTLEAIGALARAVRSDLVDE
jgi:hypothetical protein